MKTFVESTNINKRYSLNTIDVPLIIYLKVTGCCNMNCSFCSQHENKKTNMNINNAKDLLLKLKNLGVISINYTGGEPLVYPYIEELLEFGHTLGFEQVLVTNAIDLFKHEEILKYIDVIGISLHGRPNIHDRLCNKKGAFNIVKQNIDRLLKEYPMINVNINYTLTSDNIDMTNMKFIKNFAQKRKIKLCFGRLNYIGAAHDNNIINPDMYLQKVYDLIKEYNNISISNCIASCTCNDKYKFLNHPCGAGISILSIESNGDVKICPSSNYVLGNAFNKSLKSIINSKALKEYKKLNWLPNICRICKDFEHCKGGCHAEGNNNFFENTCDALIINKQNEIWKSIEKNKLLLKCKKIRKEKNKYLIIKAPIRRIDKIGYKIITSIDGTKSGKDLIVEFPKIKNIKEFLCTLYNDGIIEVNYEKEKN